MTKSISMKASHPLALAMGVGIASLGSAGCTERTDITWHEPGVYKGDVEFESELKTTIFNYETIEAKLVIPPGKTGEYPHTVTIHYGTNANHTRVRLR